MLKFKGYIILLIILQFFANQAKSQDVPGLFSIKYSIMNSEKFNVANDSIGQFRNNQVQLNYISKDFIYNHYFGGICKWESKRDNRTKQKIRFRLGSLDYVDKLEGK